MPAPQSRRAEARTRYYTREEAQRLGWDVRHPTRGGLFLEEQELVDFYPPLKNALGLDRPDFAAIASDGNLRAIIECKADVRELETALREASEYADAINRVQNFDVRIAVGVAGTPDKFVQTRGAFWSGRKWVSLSSHGHPLTQIPTLHEIEIALTNGNGTTDVQLPDEREFFDAAIRISRILRLAKIEEALRPKVIGALILALFHGEFSLNEDVVLGHINSNVRASITKFQDLPQERRDFLIETLTLSTEAVRLRSAIKDIVHQLERLNVRSIMRSGVDFLGQFYETFLRYGQDAKKLGIVFTPRHITRFCADMSDVNVGMTVYDPAAGTGGFLVAAFDRMMANATTEAARRKSRSSLYGCDTNPTVWALAILNMFFKGDGKSNIVYGSCFDSGPSKTFDRVLMNPPFSQEGEPETDFINHALERITPGGQAAIVVKTTVMVDSDLAHWRRALVAEHHVLAVISLPVELFYPSGAPTVILILRAHTPDAKRGTFLAQVFNDGYRISKKRRVPATGSQLPNVQALFDTYLAKGDFETVPNFARVVGRDRILNGEEICAEQWLPSSTFDLSKYEQEQKDLMRQLSLAVVNNPDVTDELIEDYDELLAAPPTVARPTARATLADWFHVSGGKSSGVDGYVGGSIPYISSGDMYNGIVDLITPPEGEVFDAPHLTVSAFGGAYIQPWKFCARGNGGSAVKVLRPKFCMTLAELFWMAGQINAQRWRFHYGRMATTSRLKLLEVDCPIPLPEISNLAGRLKGFRQRLSILTEGLDDSRESVEFLVHKLAAEWRDQTGHLSSLERKVMHPAYQRILALGKAAVPSVLQELREHGGHWSWALQFMTGENPAVDAGSIRSAKNAWLHWGRTHGYINE